jgi:hypothetical protein
MTSWSDLDGEMQRVPLDVDTADRLLAGSVAPDDAPPGYAGVAVFLTAARTESEPVELSREAATVAALAAAVRSSIVTAPAKSPRRSFVPRFRTAATFAAAALFATAGLAAAGSLPGAAQDIASQMLAKVGVSVPGPNSNAGSHPNVRGNSGDSLQPQLEQANSGKGSEVSELATSTELEGVEKGAAISSLASEAKSQAGEHGQAGDDHGPPVATANQGGTATADTASAEHSTNGTSTADTASGGASSAGSENNSAGQTHRP